MWLVAEALNLAVPGRRVLVVLPRGPWPLAACFPPGVEVVREGVGGLELLEVNSLSGWWQASGYQDVEVALTVPGVLVGGSWWRAQVEPRLGRPRDVRVAPWHL